MNRSPGRDREARRGGVYVCWRGCVKENVELAISVTCSALLGALGRGSHGPGAVAAFIASQRGEHGGPHGVLSVACPDLGVRCESRAHPQARRGSPVIGSVALRC